MASADFQPRLSFSSLSSSSSSSTAFIPLHKTQLHPRMHPPSLSLPPNPPKSNASRHPHKHLLLIVSLSLLPFSLYLLSLYRSLHVPSPSTFGLVIEIADSHSQIRVFRSLNEVSGTPFSGESSDFRRAEPGLSGSDPVVVGRVVSKLVGFAKEKIPDSEWKATRVQLMVTAERRDAVEPVLAECRGVLRSSGFMFRDDWASVLRGQDEGLYNWVAINYALGYLGKKPQETAGVILLGRSAMQVSFASDEPSKSSAVLKFLGVTYNLYTQSLQQFGQDAVWKLLHKQNSQELRSLAENGERPLRSACIPRGYELTPLASDKNPVKSPATGNFSSCKSEVLALLNSTQEKCANPPCELSASVLIELEKKPHPQHKFFLASELQGLVPKASVPELEAIGHHFCEDDWENLKKQYDVDYEYLARSCFAHAFMATLLHDSLGIPLDDKRVGFAAGSTPVDWRLGAFIAQTIMEPLESEEVEEVETHIIGNESISYFVLFAILLVFVLLAAFFVMKLRKPQFKTVYDLEKGCYIVTRVAR